MIHAMTVCFAVKGRSYFRQILGRCDGWEELPLHERDALVDDAWRKCQVEGLDESAYLAHLADRPGSINDYLARTGYVLWRAEDGSREYVYAEEE